MKNKIIIHNINQLITLAGKNSVRQGQEMADVEIITDGYIVIEDGKFLEIGEGNEYQNHDGEYINAKGMIVSPGLIDSHTHLVHGGSREDEFEMKLQGVSYLDILKAGGGILNTVSKTTVASENDLFIKGYKTLNTILEHGVTCVEAKSGYGLELETELKQLRVARYLNEQHPITIKNTFLGAHAIPMEYRDQKVVFINKIKDMILEVKKQNLAEFCDVFCEEGVFSVAETQEILEYAKELGFGLKIHADEIVSLGGAKLASELQCISADHLLVTTVEDIKALAKSGVIASILPLTSFYLNKPYAKTRLMIDNNCGLTISTDYNPGSSPCENLQLSMQVAAIKTQMTPKEIMTAVTINAAVSLGVEASKGSIEKGKDADLVIFDCPNLDYLFYHFGVNHVKDVYIKGELVVRDQKVKGD